MQKRIASRVELKKRANGCSVIGRLGSTKYGFRNQQNTCTTNNLSVIAKACDSNTKTAGLNPWLEQKVVHTRVFYNSSMDKRDVDGLLVKGNKSKHISQKKVNVQTKQINSVLVRPRTIKRSIHKCDSTVKPKVQLTDTQEVECSQVLPNEKGSNKQDTPESTHDACMAFEVDENEHVNVIGNQLNTFVEGIESKMCQIMKGTAKHQFMSG